MVRSQLSSLLLTEVRRRLFDESIPRLEKCLGMMSESEIWHRPNENSNSVGNLVLHLCGNCRQWVISTLGHVPDERQRQQEFDERGPIPTPDLIRMLHTLREELNRVLHTLSPDMLAQTYDVQGYSETGLGILLHVVEHFSYHVGQVTYYVKASKDVDTRYYAGQDLDRTGG